MIESIAPKKWVSDKDERLLGAGEMSFAQNVLISERGEGTLGVLKTMKGTAEIPAASTEDAATYSDWKVLGSVADDQRDRLYVFVNTNEYQNAGRVLMVENNEWKTIAKKGLLLDRNSSVSAAVVTKAFQQDGVVQSAIYFTDNVHNPYKINVDRAIDGFYDDSEISTSSSAPAARRLLSVMKMAPLDPPSFEFVDDPDYQSNNFKSETFQFACQYIYIDGEESSLSPYSKLAVSPYLNEQSIVEISTGITTGNVCVIRLPWNLFGLNFDSGTSSLPDIEKIRILARQGNTGVFSVIDEVIPNENKTRKFGATTKVVYDASTNEYRFYNDGIYTAISEQQSQKTFDNVPQKAESVSIVGNRLMFSNYTEGYPNYEDNINSIGLQVNYLPEASAGDSFHLSAAGATDAAIAYGLNGGNSGQDGEFLKAEVRIELASTGFEWPNPNTAAATVPAGAVTRLSFSYDPVGAYHVISDGVSLIEGCTSTVNGSPVTFDLRIAASTADQIQLYPASRQVDGNVYFDERDKARFSVQYESVVDETVETICDNIRTQLQNDESIGVKNYIKPSTGIISSPDAVGGLIENSSNTSLLPNGNNILFEFGKFRATFGFDMPEDPVNDDGKFLLKPYLKDFKILEGGRFYPSGNEFWDNLTLGTQSPTTLQNPVAQKVFQMTSVTSSTDAAGTTINPQLYLSNRSIYSAVPSNNGTFKHGSSHDFGIVFYDLFGRPGFVNKLGSVYVKHPSERTASELKGPAQIVLDIPQEQPQPYWAYQWAPVYAGSEFSNVFQYTTGGAYVARDENNQILVDDKRIFVSLKTLTQHREKTASTRDYSFTKGDICRVIRYTDGTTTTYATSNDVNRGIVEFEVVGVENFGKTNSPITGSTTAGDPVADAKSGEFLVLRSSSVEGGQQVDADDDGTLDDDLKYRGFDWFSITNNAYPNDTNPDNSAVNYWGQETLIEILTPRKTSDSRVYYEIGESRKFDPPGSGGSGGTGDWGGDMTLSDGDVSVRSVSCISPKLVSSSWNKTDPENWAFTGIALEDNYPSEISTEKAWSRGRAHSVFEAAATVNRYNSIVYSDPYVDDTAWLRLSSFTPSTSNFFDLPSEHGRCSFIGKNGDNLIAIQENKVSRLGVNKDVLQTASQSGLVSLSSDVINNIVPYSADLGCRNPESVTVRDGVTYFADVERRALVKVAPNGISVLSDVDNKGYIEDQFDALNGKISSGYDPEEKMVFFTFDSGDTANGLTVGWDEKTNSWMSTYTFVPDRFASLRGRFFGLSSPALTTSDSVVHEFIDSQESNKFLGATITDESKVDVVFNDNPNRVKVYNSLSIDGDRAWSVKVESSEELESTTLDFTEKEGLHYAWITPDLGGLGVASSSYLPVGRVSAFTDADQSITIDTSLRGMHIPMDSILYRVESSGFFSMPGSGIQSVDRSSGKLFFSNAPSTFSGLAVGKELVVRSLGLSGDKIRGNWAKAKMTYNPSSVGAANGLMEASKNELHAVNANYQESKASHSVANQ